LLIPIAICDLTTLPTWTGAVNAGTRSQLIDVPIVLSAFFRSHMTDVDCSVIIVHVDLRDEFWKGINEKWSSGKEALHNVSCSTVGVELRLASAFLLSPLDRTAEKEKYKANM
jgi:hypothetical protein